MGTMDISEAIKFLVDSGIVDDYYASEYGEPGYSSDGPVLLGNYWCRCGGDLHDIIDRHHKDIEAVLEEAGAELQWHDEWVVVNDKAYRTQPNSYSWQPSAIFNADTCEYLTPDDDLEEWVEWAKDDSTRCIPRRIISDTVLVENGWQSVERGESGWYGVEDSPEEMAKYYQDQGYSVLFRLDNTEQFRVEFTLWVRKDDE